MELKKKNRLELLEVLLAFIILITCAFNSIGQIDPSDGCTGAPSLTVNSSCVTNSYTLDGAYTNGYLVNPSCDGGNNRDDGWYSFVGTGGTVTIELTGNRDHTLAVRDACGGGSELACDFVTSGNTASVSLATTAAVVYYIQVHRNSGNNTADMTGTICLHDPTVPAPPTDCSNAIQVCASTGFPGNSSGAGTQELNASNRGCLNGNEHQSSWYYISVGTAGVLQFTIAPTVGSDDYDFALWGPASSCPPSSVPIRCSYAAGGGNTGLSAAESPQTTEGSGGNRFVDVVNATAGQVYLLCVDNYSSSSTTFNLNFGGTAGISCVPLPVELISFEGSINSSSNLLKWTTKSEINNDYFTIERSTDGENWDYATNIKGGNNSSVELNYDFNDYTFSPTVNYYRLSQTDYDGEKRDLQIISIDNREKNVEVVKIMNLVGQEVDASYTGVKIYVYSDGTVIKRVSSPK